MERCRGKSRDTNVQPSPRLSFAAPDDFATQAQIQNFLNTQQIDFFRTNPLTGAQINYKQIEPGTIADIPRGMQYVQPPGAGNAAGFVELLHVPSE
ncbi:MAG TPA: hypothetical protein VK395_17710 [Gemmataceae bacterium]|nr:hypothetical protein [Gemmataceae bacterium]